MLQVKLMRRAFFLSIFALLLSTIIQIQAQVSKPVETIPVSAIHTGMRGVAYTVFQGTKPESMGVEVLGILKNANGPKGDIILVRLSGEKAEYTGVVAGMSGSPVYLNGKLAGALAFRIGEFSKEPIAGVTPIAEMLEINAMDRTPGSSTVNAKAGVIAPSKTSGPGVSESPSTELSNGFANYLKPIETPLAFSGFSQEAMERFAPQFAKAGIVPVMGVGSVSDSKQPEALEPGSAVSAILVRGDMDIAATCTVTYMDAEHLLACGHPLLQFGMHGVNEYGEDTTYRMNGRISVNGYPDVTVQNMFAPSDGGQPAAVMAALSLGERFSRIYDNPYNVPGIRGVQLDFDLVRERRWARLEGARTDVTEARPGDEITIETVLRPYRGEVILHQIPIHVPTSTSKGSLRILVSDGETLDRIRHASGPLGRKLDLASTISLLNKQHVNNRIYVSLLEADPEAMVADKVMPTLPLSIMNVMDGMRGTQEMVVQSESSVNEAATGPLDYVVAGAQVLTITIK